MAPVVAVRGNIDKGEWASALPLTAVAEASTTLIYVLHDVNEVDLDPAAAGFHVVISGHSHKPGRAERGGVTYLNPGSAGPRRFTLPIAVARLFVRGPALDAEIHELPVADHHTRADRPHRRLPG